MFVDGVMVVDVIDEFFGDFCVLEYDFGCVYDFFVVVGFVDCEL